MNFDFLTGINTLGGGVLGYLIPFLFVLTVVVFFHELGHFLVARRCGVRVLVFSIGFGPELFGFNDRHGTRWKLSAIPLGGYVKFLGDENAASVPMALDAMSEEERRHSFVAQSIGRRAAIVVAGPAANFILAVLIFAALFMVFGVGYYMVAGQPYQNQNLVKLGIIGKLAFAVIFIANMLRLPNQIPRLFLTPVIGDLVFVVLFTMFLSHARRSGK